MSKSAEPPLDQIGQPITSGNYCVVVLHNELVVCKVISLHSKSVKLEHFDREKRELRARWSEKSPLIQRSFDKVLMLVGDQLTQLVLRKLSAE